MQGSPYSGLLAIVGLVKVRETMLVAAAGSVIMRRGEPGTEVVGPVFGGGDVTPVDYSRPEQDVPIDSALRIGIRRHVEVGPASSVDPTAHTPIIDAPGTPVSVGAQPTNRGGLPTVVVG